MFKVPDSTTVNTKEYKPNKNGIGFAPELIKFIQDNKKLTTYRFGKKYDHFNIGDVITYQNSTTSEDAGKLRIVGKRETRFIDLPLSHSTHEYYRDKEHQRKVLSGYYAFIGREITDADLFLVFDFELA